MKGPVKFDIRGQAIDPSYIKAEIVREVNAIFGEGTISTNYIDFDVTNYFTPDGRKVTKPIKGLLNKLYPNDKKNINDNFPPLANAISKLYLPVLNVKANWGDKGEIGEGIWESHETCFRDGGENEMSKKFLVKYRRVKFLTLRAELGTKILKARCLVYFSGGRSIELFNFYWKNGFPQNKIIFVEAVKRMFNLEKVTYAPRSIYLPVYKNRDGIVVHADRSFSYERGHKYPCPACGNVVPADEFICDDSNTRVLLGCSDACAGVHEVSCDHCGDYVGEDEIYSTAAGETICGYCFENSYIVCRDCGDTVHQDDAIFTDNRTYCNSCASSCDLCGEFHSNQNLTSVGRGNYCNDCTVTCDGCGDVFADDDYELMTVQDGDSCCSQCRVECSQCHEVIADYAVELGEDGKPFCSHCHSMQDADTNDTQMSLAL